MTEQEIVQAGFVAYVERLGKTGCSKEERSVLQREYRRMYHRVHKRNRRSKRQEYIVSFQKDVEERLKAAAKNLGISVTKYIVSLLQGASGSLPGRRQTTQIDLESAMIALLNFIEDECTNEDIKPDVQEKITHELAAMRSLMQ